MNLIMIEYQLVQYKLAGDAIYACIFKANIDFEGLTSSDQGCMCYISRYPATIHILNLKVPQFKRLRAVNIEPGTLVRRKLRKKWKSLICQHNHKNSRV